MNSMPPEPPLPNSEADYNPAPRRGGVGAAPFEPDSHRPFGVDDVPIPAHLLSPPETPDLNAAWAAVLGGDHDPIPKRGHNKFFNYDYATADDIRSYVGREVGKNGLHYEQHMAGYTVWGNLIRVTYYFVVRHSSGQSSPPIRHDELVRTTSEKGTPDDKALGKAGVLALKNFSKVHFSVDTGDLMDDPDADGPVVEPKKATPNQSANRSAPRDHAPPQPTDGWRAVLPDEVFAPGRSFRMNQSTGVNEVHEPPKTPTEATFAERAETSLNSEPNGTKWLKVLDACLAQAQTLDDIGAVRAVDSFKFTMAKAPTLIKQQIEDMIAKAVVRLSPPFNGNGKHDETMEGNGESTAAAVAEALKAEKTEEDGKEWEPGDP